MTLIAKLLHSQRRGIGSALLSHVLNVCDAQKVSAYLEATNSRNVGLYERHGFEAVGRIQVGILPRLSRCYARQEMMGRIVSKS